MNRIFVSTRGSLVVLLGLLSVVVRSQTQCSDFENIGNEKRSLRYELNVTANEQSLCDTYLSPIKWYSFDERTGSEIPELDTLGPNVCGATSPIFIVARTGESYHNEAKRTKVATTAPVQSADGGYNRNILILFCEDRSIQLGKDAFVYQLQPAGCPLAYCAGDKPACPFGMFWNGIPGVERCVPSLPSITSATLRGPVIARTATVIGQLNKNITVKQFSFYCDTDYPPQQTDDGARFKITIYLDDSESDINVDAATALNPSAEIVETLLRGNLGKTLKCGARAFWFGNENPVYTDELKSNSYWMGIKSTIDPVIVNYNSADKTARITFQSTVPITCWHCILKPNWRNCQAICKYPFAIATKPEAGLGAKRCYMDIDETTDEGEVTVQVTSVFPTPIAYYNLHFEPMKDKADYDPHVLWRDYYVKNTSVQFRQSFSLMKCESTGDPHITTIRRVTIHNYRVGVFNLASSFLNASGVYLQIQVRQVACGTVSCNCAIIIREFNEAHKIDACNRNSALIATILQPFGGPRATIWRTNNQFTVMFPSGLTARVDAGYNYINIYLTIPGFYTGYFDGLCTETASQSDISRVLSNDPRNMFERAPNCSQVVWQDFECECKNNEIPQCTGGPFRSDVPVVPRNTGAVCDTNRRSRSLSWTPTIVRSVTNSDDYIDPNEIYSSIPYDPNFGSNVNPVWPTLSGINEQQATVYCLNTIKSSSAYTSCAGKFDEAVLVSNCKLDVQLLDKLEGGETYRTTMESHCLDTIVAESNVTSIQEMRANPLVVNVTNNMCPNACSNQGTCSNGVCTCSNGYVGSDCSINANSPAVIRSLYQNGSCDTQSRACANTNVEVVNVYDAGSLACRFKRFHLTNTSIQLPSVDVKGILNTLNEVRCPSPPDDVSADNGKRQLYGYKLSVSSDGAQFSNEMILNVYDSACLTCQPGSTTCQQTSNTCFIDSQCQSSGVRRNTSVDCLSCIPQTNMAAWTDTVTWSAWSACSRLCDSGVRKRQLVCSTPPSPAFTAETEFCQTTKCPGQPDERTRGIIISTSANDVKAILSDEQAFFGEIVKAVNSYCGSHSADCCTALGLTPSAQSGAPMNVTTGPQCFYAASFPDIWSTPARHKVIVKAYTSSVRAQCTGTSSLPAEIYFDNNIIIQAVTAAKSTIENALGVTLISITLP